MMSAMVSQFDTIFLLPKKSFELSLYDNIYNLTFYDL